MHANQVVVVTRNVHAEFEVGDIVVLVEPFYTTSNCWYGKRKEETSYIDCCIDVGSFEILGEL